MLHTQETELMEQQELREKCIERIEVLDRVKKLFLVPGTQMATTRMVADFFGVGLETIQSCYKDNKTEIDTDGVLLMNFNDILGLSLKNNPKIEYQPIRGGTKCLWNTGEYSDENKPVVVEIVFNNRGTKMFSKRAILRIAMLLRDSVIAKEIRTQLLNTFEHSTDEHRTANINEEHNIMLEIGKASLYGDVPDLLTAVNKAFNFKNRHIAIIENENLALKEDNKRLAAGILEWSDRASLNKAVRILAGKVMRPYAIIFKQLYDELRYKHGIGLTQRGSQPYIQYIRENEWNNVILSFCALCEDYNESPSLILKKAKLSNQNKTDENSSWNSGNVAQ